MEEPCARAKVWVAFDHTARLLPALVEKPADFVAFPAPAGAKGRGFMPVMVGIAIRRRPDHAASRARDRPHDQARHAGADHERNRLLPGGQGRPRAWFARCMQLASRTAWTAAFAAEGPARGQPAAGAPGRARAANSTRSTSTPSPASCCAQGGHQDGAEPSGRSCWTTLVRGSRRAVLGARMSPAAAAALPWSKPRRAHALDARAHPVRADRSQHGVLFLLVLFVWPLGGDGADGAAHARGRTGPRAVPRSEMSGRPELLRSPCAQHADAGGGGGAAADGAWRWAWR